MNLISNNILITFTKMNQILLALSHIDKNNNDIDDQTIFNVMWKPTISIKNYVRRIYIHIFNNIHLLSVTIYYISLYIIMHNFRKKSIKLASIGITRSVMSVAPKLISELIIIWFREKVLII